MRDSIVPRFTCAFGGRRASICRTVIARYEAAAQKNDRNALARLERLIDDFLRILDERDLRNRVELLLLKSRILLASNQRAKAEDAYRSNRICDAQRMPCRRSTISI